MMNHQYKIAIAQKLLEGIGSDRSPTEIANLFDAEVVFEIQGDDGVLPWIGRKTGRRAIVNFVRDIRALTEPITLKWMTSPLATAAWQSAVHRRRESSQPGKSSARSSRSS